jgi:hypothetical protein
MKSIEKLRGRTMQRLLHQCLFICSAIFIIGLLYHHSKLVLCDIPLDTFEPATSYITGILMSEQDPYSQELQPVAATVYPLLYNQLMAPLAKLLGNSLELHRAISGFFLLGCCLLVYIACRRLGTDQAHSLAATALTYAALLYHNTPIASGNTLGLLLFLLCLMLPWLFNYSIGALVVSALIGVLAFFGKQYFVVAPAILCLYLIYRLSLRTAFFYGMVFLTTFVFTTATLAVKHPYFLDNVLFAPMVASGFTRSDAHLWRQLGHYIYLNAALLAAIFLLVLRELRTEVSHSRHREFRFICYIFMMSLLVISLSLGKNVGNEMTYLFQLMSPFLLVALFYELSRWRSGMAFQLPLILLSFIQAWTWLDHDMTVDKQNWEKMDRMISEHETVLAPPFLAQFMIDKNKTFYEGPLTFWFHYASLKPGWAKGLIPGADARAVTRKHIVHINQMIEAEDFDLILLRKGHWGVIGASATDFPLGGDGQTQFRDHYILRETLSLPLPERPGGGKRRIQVWTPANQTAAMKAW